MQVADIIACLEHIAPPQLQESYDNSGLLVGDSRAEITNVLVCLDSTPEIIEEAIRRDCNLVIAHHPIIFGGLKRVTGANYVERTVMMAIKNDIAIYACHTNLDNVLFKGVNGRIAERLGLMQIDVLEPKESELVKDTTGAGVIGLLSEPMGERKFLEHLAGAMQVNVLKHTRLLDRDVQKVAVCGGSGSFLLHRAKAAGAQVFITGDIKYHDYFDAEDEIVLIDIGHFESERFTIDLICDLISEKFHKFAPLSAETNTNPVEFYTQ